MIPKLKHTGKNFLLLAGPCVIEGEEMAFNIAGKNIRNMRQAGNSLCF